MTETSALTTGSPLLDRPGAVAGSPPDDRVASHYGDPFREQRALLGGTAGATGWVDTSDRAVVTVAGEDRLTWLHTLTSQHLADLAPGGATEALVLSAHGHVEHHLRVRDDGERTWLTLEPGTAPALLDYLARMVFWSRVEVTDVSGTWASLTAPAAEGLVERLVARAELAAYADQVVAGRWALEAYRVERGIPRLGFETDHRTIPHEVGWLDTAVHLQKGCYRGQETVARVHNLGRPPRRLVRLHLDGSGERLPARGSAVGLDRPLGFVGTAVRHFELGPVALAVVKRTVGEGDTVSTDGVAAVVDSVLAG